MYQISIVKIYKQHNYAKLHLSNIGSEDSTQHIY